MTITKQAFKTDYGYRLMLIADTYSKRETIVKMLFGELKRSVPDAEEGEIVVYSGRKFNKIMGVEVTHGTLPEGFTLVNYSHDFYSRFA